MKSQNPLWSSLGRVNLMFIPVILAPSNPQTYNPLSFLFTCFFLVAAAALLLAAQTLIPPVSNDKRRMRLLADARKELQEPATHQNGEAPEETMFRDASRIGQFLAAGGAQDSRALADMLSCFDEAAMLRLCDAKLMQLAEGPLAPLANEARAATVNRDTATLRSIAHRLRQPSPPEDSIEADVAACLVLTSNILDRGGVDSSREAS